MNPSSFDPDDAKLTAYALGELPEGTDWVAVEQLLASSPEARAEVEQIRSMASLLVAEYENERQDAARAAVEPFPIDSQNLVVFPDQKRAPAQENIYAWLSAAAALVLLASVGWTLVSHGRRKQVDASMAVTQPSPRPASPSRRPELPAAAPIAPTPIPSSTPATLLALNKDVANDAFSLDPLKSETRAVPAQSATGLDDINAPYDVQSRPPALVSLPPAADRPDVQPPPGTEFQRHVDTARSLPAAMSPKWEAAQEIPLTGKPVADAGQVSATSKQRPMLAEGVVYGNPSGPTLRAGTAPRVALDTTVQREASRRETFRGVQARPYGSTSTSTTVLDEPMAPPPASLAYEAEDRPRLRTIERIPLNRDTAAYDHLTENAFLTAKDYPLSTFSIDVDTASYANVRRFIESGTLPPKDAVRVEELLNYFPYNDAPPAEGNPHPFALHLEAAACPWEPAHRLVRIGIKGRELARDKRPASNLVFLIDVSGSMMPPERLPLIKEGLRLLVEKLTEDDHVSIVVYAGNTGLALPSTSGDHKDKILAVLDHLEAGGSTNGAGGIQLAYKVAQENFIKGGVNRVILATDGDFNVGITNQNELVRLIEKEAKGGVFLSALGVGTDNYKDSTMQKLADRGNGNYAYIDRLEEARKVLVEQMSGTLVTIAKDVKIQVEFNPTMVASYRLIGYEKRLLRKEDFNDDKVDAGEIGAGHSVTALYEIVPAAGRGGSNPAAGVDSLKYQSPAPIPTPMPVETPAAGDSPELLTLKMRYKAPDADKSERAYEQPLVDHPGTDDDLSKASADLKFAAAVAEFGLVLRDSPYKGSSTLDAVLELARDGRGPDASGYRTQFIDLVRRAQTLESRDR